jgi:two-component system, OmpR family, response regulator VicR
MKKILIVEDEKALNDAYCMILKNADFKVTCALNGEEALTLANNEEPDLILLDLRMPKMNGLEFLKAFDQPGSHPNTKIIVFSNLDMQGEIDQAYQLGAQKYMLKAWASPQELVKLVQATLTKQRAKK